MRILLAGATGLVGSHCLRELLGNELVCERVSKVIVVSRRELSASHARLESSVVEFGELDNNKHLFKDVDAIICCLGTTRKKAGSRDAFYQVDYQYCYDLARLGLEQGVGRFYIISAIGASERSPVFYSRIKGKLEHNLKLLQFKHLSLFRPSLLIGERNEKRPVESMGIRLSPLYNPVLSIIGLRKYKAIPAEIVAKAIVKDAVFRNSEDLPLPSVSIHTHDDIVQLSKLSPLVAD